MMEHKYVPITVISCDGTTMAARPCEEFVEGADDDAAILIAETIGFTRLADGRWLCRECRQRLDPEAATPTEGQEGG